MVMGVEDCMCKISGIEALEDCMCKISGTEASNIKHRKEQGVFLKVFCKLSLKDLGFTSLQIFIS